MSTLPRFVVTASLARIVSEGLALGLALLALDRTGSTSAAGWLLAVATFPQLLTGPSLGPFLDRSARPWRVLRLAAAATAVAVVAIVVSFDRGPSAVPVAAALVIACTEPLLTGGLERDRRPGTVGDARVRLGFARLQRRRAGRTRPSWPP